MKSINHLFSEFFIVAFSLKDLISYKKQGFPPLVHFSLLLPLDILHSQQYLTVANRCLRFYRYHYELMQITSASKNCTQMVYSASVMSHYYEGVFSHFYSMF